MFIWTENRVINLSFGFDANFHIFFPLKKFCSNSVYFVLLNWKLFTLTLCSVILKTELFTSKVIQAITYFFSSGSKDVSDKSATIDFVKLYSNVSFDLHCVCKTYLCFT